MGMLGLVVVGDDTSNKDAVGSYDVEGLTIKNGSYFLNLIL